MLPHIESDLQLGALALESDFLSSEQLSCALGLWIQDTRESLLQILIDQQVLTDNDVQLLQALWEQRCSRLQTQLSAAEVTSEHRPASDWNPSLDFEIADDKPQIDLTSCPRQASSVSSQSSFEVRQFVAAGGIGRVSVAIDRALNRRVALKEMLPRFAKDPTARLRFAREAEITGSLEHPAIVPIHHYGHDTDGAPFYCMRWIDGRNLREQVDRLQLHSSPDSFSSIDFRRLLQSFITICQATAHAHSRGIIHRDIKPANILIGEHGETVLVDWGLAKYLNATERAGVTQPDSRCSQSDNQPSEPNQGAHFSAASDVAQVRQLAEETEVDCLLTTDGAMIGTPAFMSPEQANGEPAEIASDIFALGASLYFILTGRAPFVGPTTFAVLQQARQCQPDYSPISIGQAPAALVAICSKAMQRDSAKRYASATELSAEIERWLADEPVTAWVDAWPTRSRRWMKKHSATTTAMVVSAMALVAGSSLYSVITRAANERLLAANRQEQLARKVADEQSDLALSSLQLVTFDIQRQLQHIPAAQKVRAKLLETALQGLEKVAVGLENRQLVSASMLKAHRDLGDLFLEVGDIGATQGTSLARSQFEKAHNIALRLTSQSPADVEQQRQLAVCLQKLGEAEARTGSSATAIDFQNEALKVLEELSRSDPESETVWRSLSVSHNLLGDLELHSGSIESAGQHYLTALEIRQGQEKRTVSDPELARDLIVSLNKVGEYYLRTGQSPLAADHFQRALKSSQSLVEEHPEDFQALRDLSVAHYKVGKLAESVGENQTALMHFGQSLEMDERRLALDQSNALAQRDCVESNLQVANAARRLGDTEQAAVKLERAIALGDSMIVANPQDRAVMRKLAYAHGDLGDILLPTVSDDALSHYQRCLTFMRMAAQLDPSNPRGQSDIAFGLSKLGDGLLSIQQVDQALDTYQQALQIHRQRSAANPTDINIQRNLVSFLQRLGVTLKQASRLNEARPYFEEALANSQALAELAPDNIPVQTQRIAVLDSLGVFEHACQRDSAAAAHFRSALELSRRLLEDGKLTGEDATWPDYISAHLAELKLPEGD